MPSVTNTPRFTKELPRAADLDSWRRNPSGTIPIIAAYDSMLEERTGVFFGASNPKNVKKKKS